jgi:hypothetical protein
MEQAAKIFFFFMLVVFWHVLVIYCYEVFKIYRCGGKTFFGVEIVYFESNGKYSGRHTYKYYNIINTIEIQSGLSTDTTARIFYHEFGHAVHETAILHKKDNRTFNEFFAESFAWYCLGYNIEDANKQAITYLTCQAIILFCCYRRHMGRTRQILL